jgi:hypothetical protein
MIGSVPFATNAAVGTEPLFAAILLVFAIPFVTLVSIAALGGVFR